MEFFSYAILFIASSISSSTIYNQLILIIIIKNRIINYLPNLKKKTDIEFKH